MDHFESVPEGCISEILSRTSPEDTARSSAISKGFKAAAESDSVWDRFLPRDFTDIISRSVSPVVYSKKKELYLTLCNSPILLDGGKLSFSLDKRSGKKCFMIAARELSISWGDDRRYWEWESHPDSRFSEVASLHYVWWLDIRGKIATSMLSAATNYAAYLVFRLSDSPYGLDSTKTMVRFVNRESDEDAENGGNMVSLLDSNELRRWRNDGWMEVEMGRFYNDGVDDGDVEARLAQIWEMNWKSGLIVQGIEFRPE